MDNSKLLEWMKKVNKTYGSEIVELNVTEKDLATSFYYSIGVGLFMYLCLFISAPWIADFYDTPVLTSLIRITALSFLWGPLELRKM